MDKKTLDSMSIVMNAEELSRMMVTTNHKGETTIKLDLHELSYKRAKRLVKNIIVFNQGSYNLRIIHGYNRGTSLRTMIRKSLESSRIKEKIYVPWNPGETYLRIA